MVPAGHARPKRGRETTFSWLRVLAVLVAVVLSTSALGQAAHFRLVPHTICSEHGELLELGEGAEHAARAPEHAGDQDEAGSRASERELSLEHEHCQVLARGQREQALPTADRVELLPAALVQAAAFFATPRAAAGELPRLSLAPKTSPPRSPGC